MFDKLAEIKLFTKSNHTPGPWHIENAPTPEGRERVFVYGPNREALCSLADAKLIAAAPDLLAACQALVKVVEPEHPIELRNALDAIQKATQ